MKTLFSAAGVALGFALVFWGSVALVILAAVISCALDGWK